MANALDQFTVRELAVKANIQTATAGRAKQGKNCTIKAAKAIFEATGICLCCGRKAAERLVA